MIHWCILVMPPYWLLEADKMLVFIEELSDFMLEDRLETDSPPLPDRSHEMAQICSSSLHPGIVTFSFNPHFSIFDFLPISKLLSYWLILHSSDSSFEAQARFKIGGARRKYESEWYFHFTTVQFYYKSSLWYLIYRGTRLLCPLNKL